MTVAGATWRQEYCCRVQHNNGARDKKDRSFLANKGNALGNEEWERRNTWVCGKAKKNR